MSNTLNPCADPASAREKEEVRRFWDAQPCGLATGSDAVGSRAFFDQVEEHRYRVEWFIPRLVEFARWRSQRVLEIGCGLGTDTLQFLRAGAEVTALDLSPRSVWLAHERARQNGHRGLFLNADAETLPFADASFDLVYSWGVLHHTPDTQRAVDEVRRVLRPGGIALIMLYHRRSLRALQTYLVYGLLRGRPSRSLGQLLAEHQESPGTKAYTRGEIIRMFRAFSAARVRPILTPYDTRPRLYAWLRHFLPDALGWFLFIEAVK